MLVKPVFKLEHPFQDRTFRLSGKSKMTFLSTVSNLAHGNRFLLVMAPRHFSLDIKNNRQCLEKWTEKVRSIICVYGCDMKTHGNISL